MKYNEIIENQLDLAEENGGAFKDMNYGEMILAHSYVNTRRSWETEDVVISEIVWEENYPAFIEALEAAKFKRFIIRNASTELMKLLHFLYNEGATIVEPVILKRKNEENYPEWSAIKEIGLLIQL